jgi:hypothetical protein
VHAEDEATLTALERARVVGVLDAMAAKLNQPTPTPERQADGTYVVSLYDAKDGLTDYHEAVGPTPDAARAAAAKAIEARKG